MFNCASNLYIDVESTSTSSFSSISLANPTNANGTLNTSGFGYSLGNPGDLVIVRLIYQWPIAGSGLVGALMNPVSPNNYTLVATVAFRNEPYTPRHDDAARISPHRRRAASSEIAAAPPSSSSRFFCR